MKLLLVLLTGLSLVGCASSGVSYRQIPGVVNVVSVDAQGRLTYSVLPGTVRPSAGPAESLSTYDPFTGKFR